MDADMVSMFPKGIRALMIDDDTKFLKSATTLLSVLNFDVVRCGSVAHALKSLTGGGLVGFDVILVHAANVAACGFDFRAIVETDLLIPVIYFLEEDYEATGDEANELLRTLQAAGSYIIKKPLDIEEVRTRLWTVLAFRKCDLQTKASRGGGAGGEGVGGDDEDRVHFKVVTKGRGRKRKGATSRIHPGRSSTGATVAAGGHRAAKGKEKENVGSQQLQPAQQNDDRAKKAQKSGGGEAYNLHHQPNMTMTNGQQQQLVQHQPKPSDDLVTQSFLRMLAVPPNNPKFFTPAAGPSSAAAPFDNNIITTGGAPATPRARPLYSASAGPPALHLVAHHQQHPSAHNSVIFGNIAPSLAAAPTMAAAAAATYEPSQFSQGISNKQQQQDVHPLLMLMFGPFPYQGPTLPPPPVVHQDIRCTEAVAYGNDASFPFVQAPNLGAQQDGAKEFPDMVDMEIMNSSMAPPMAKMLDLLFSDDFNAGSSVDTPGDVDHVPDMASSLDELTALAGGAFGSNNILPLMASQAQGTGAATMEADDNAAAGHKEAMLPSYQYEDDDNTSFPLDALLGELHGSMFELDDDDDLDAMQVGGSTGDGAADDAKGDSLIAGEESGGENGLANLAGVDIPHDV